MYGRVNRMTLVASYDVVYFAQETSVYRVVDTVASTGTACRG